MAYYAELNGIINNVISEKILRNQNLCKLLYYYPSEESLHFDPLAQSDITNTQSLLLDKVFPLPKMPESSTVKSGYLTVTLTGGEDMIENQGYRNINLTFDIICHLDVWFIKGGLRPYLIAEEIDKMFNNQHTDLPITNKPYNLNFKQRDYANFFYGLQLIYQLTIDSNTGCAVVPKTVDNELIMEQVPNFLPKNIGFKRRDT